MQPEPTPDLSTYQAQLDQACYLHNYVLGSRAGDCHGLPPYQVHPEVETPHQPYWPEAELLLFSLARMDQFLAQFTWQHPITVSGQVFIGQQVYYVGQKYQGRHVIVQVAPFCLLASSNRPMSETLPGYRLGCYDHYRLGS